jgi:hypothetical protein
MAVAVAVTVAATVNMARGRDVDRRRSRRLDQGRGYDVSHMRIVQGSNFGDRGSVGRGGHGRLQMNSVGD